MKNISLPENWEWCKAQDYMDIRDGTHDSPKYVDKGYPLVTSKNLVNGKIDFSTCSFITKEDHDAISKRSAVDDGDILYAMIGTIGNPVIVEKKHEFSIKNVALFKFKNKNVFNKYIYHFLNSEITKRQFSSNSRGGTQQFVSLKNIRELKIPLPPLAEQQKIASILDAADSLRQKDQQLIKKYTALSQSLFLEMFGDPVSNPMGWDKKPLKDVGIVRTGNTPSRENLEYYGTHIEWIKTNNINKPSMYLTHAEEYLSKAGLKVGRCVEPGSLLVTCIAGSKSVIGNVAIADRKVAFNQQINSFTPFEGNVLFFYSLFIAGKKHIQSFSTDSMKGMINKSKFEGIDFIIPPIELQNQYAERIQSIEAQKKLAQASLKKSDALFNSLLQRAFKGELTA
ncbi:MAG: restriction endonuclease subunit S [Methylococcaceae bacterium]